LWLKENTNTANLYKQLPEAFQLNLIVADLFPLKPNLRKVIKRLYHLHPNIHIILCFLANKTAFLKQT